MQLRKMIFLFRQWFKRIFKTCKAEILQELKEV